MDSLSTAGKVVFTVIGAIAIIGAATTGLIVKAFTKDKNDDGEVAIETDGEE